MEENHINLEEAAVRLLNRCFKLAELDYIEDFDELKELIRDLSEIVYKQKELIKHLEERINYWKHKDLTNRLDK